MPIFSDGNAAVLARLFGRKSPKNTAEIEGFRSETSDPNIGDVERELECAESKAQSVDRKPEREKIQLVDGTF